MGVIRFEGDTPFELFMDKNARVSVEDDLVVMTATVFTMNNPDDKHGIQLVMKFGNATALGLRLLKASRDAKANNS